jgi:hypothetical protein
MGAMAYSQDLASAARRHLAAADRLDAADAAHLRKRDVAGYLYGIAGECALKQIMRESGIRPLDRSERREDPYYAHFPELKAMLGESISGRHSGTLRRFSEDSALMNHWDTDMRYAPGKDVKPDHVDRWKEHAQEIVDRMEEG